MTEQKELTIEKELSNDKVDTNKTQKLKVCAYCRVSTDSEEQMKSYDAQVSEYTKK